MHATSIHSPIFGFGRVVGVRNISVSLYPWSLSALVPDKEFPDPDASFLISVARARRLPGHNTVPLDALELDCGGCEWDVIRDALKASGTSGWPRRISAVLHVDDGSRAIEPRLAAIYRTLFTYYRPIAAPVVTMGQSAGGTLGVRVRLERRMP
jgi:hypothetical protein